MMRPPLAPTPVTLNSILSVESLPPVAASRPPAGRRLVVAPPPAPIAVPSTARLRQSAVEGAPSSPRLQPSFTVARSRTLGG